MTTSNILNAYLHYPLIPTYRLTIVLKKPTYRILNAYIQSLKAYLLYPNPPSERAVLTIS